MSNEKDENNQPRRERIRATEVQTSTVGRASVKLTLKHTRTHSCFLKEMGREEYVQF